MEVEYRFDHNWFGTSIDTMEYLFSSYTGQPRLNILEIGSFEGMSTVWMLEHIKDSTITCIDTWEGGVDHDPNNSAIDFKKARKRFDHNISYYIDRVRVIEKRSFDALVDLYKEGEKFNFVYVDGSHTAADVNADLVLSWPLINVGGIIYCDDYDWGFNADDLKDFPKLDFTYDSPKLGIDSFVNVYRPKLKPIRGCGNNVAVFVKMAE